MGVVFFLSLVRSFYEDRFVLMVWPGFHGCSGA